MDDRLTFPPVRVPAVLPHPEDLLVSLVKDEGVTSFPIPTPLTPESIPNTADARAALHAVNRLRQAFTSPFGTPDAILNCPTWLRMILETLAGIHEGFRNAQLISPDTDLPTTFRDLNGEELNTVARIFEVTSWLQDFCEAAEEEHDEDHIAPFRTICIRCVESADLPSPPATITNIMLTNALETRALRETLRNEAIRKAVKDIDTWRETQTTTLISELVANITCTDPNFKSLARIVGLDPRVQQWVDSIRPRLRESAIRMINQETIEDCFIPHAAELLETDWMRCQTEIQTEIQARSDAYDAQLRIEVEEYFKTHKKSLMDAADKHLKDLELELDNKLADEIVQLKNKAKTSLIAAKEEADTHSLSLVIRTPKTAKPSPLNIKKPKKKSKKKTAVLDLTTPPPPPWKQDGDEFGNRD